jgi:Spy/CpxP family protein refolding chaperone
MVSKPRSLKRFMPMLGLALVASLAMSAVGVASASAATQHWYAGGAKIAEKTPTPFVMKGTSKFVMKWEYQLGHFEVVCSSQKTRGGRKRNG